MQQSVSYITIDDRHAGQRMDNFLLSTLKGVPKSYVYRIIRKGEVRLNKSRVKANTRLAIGDVVRVPPVRVGVVTKPDAGKISRHDYLLDSILYQDEHILVLNKPSGLAVHAGSGVPFGVIELMRELTQARFLELVHRLDRETSGCLLLAKKRSALTHLSAAFRDNSGRNQLLNKSYLALVKDNWLVERHSVKQPLQKTSVGSGQFRMTVEPEGQYAHTRFTAVQQYADAALVEAKLFTGRTHQVRVHALASGHPLAGDSKYGDRDFNKKMREQGLKRLFLHASKLGFYHPESGEKQLVSAPLPEELERVLGRMKEK